MQEAALGGHHMRVSSGGLCLAFMLAERRTGISRFFSPPRRMRWRIEAIWLREKPRFGGGGGRCMARDGEDEALLELQ